MLDNNYSSQIKRLGIPDRVVEHGEQIELHHICGFDSEGIAEAVSCNTFYYNSNKKYQP